MSANGSTYEIPADMEKRLQFWLSMDAWQLDDAAQILSGIDPDKTIKPGASQDGGSVSGTVTLFTGLRLPELPPELECRIVHGELFDSLEPIDANYRLLDEAEQETREYEGRELEACFKKCADIARLFNAPSAYPSSPKEWIERALSKSIEIPWLEWVVDHNILPEGLRGKILVANEDGQICLVDKRSAETPAERRERLKLRAQKKKAEGCKSFLKDVADEEGISVSRLKQILADEAQSANSGSNSWAPLSSRTS